MISCYDTPTLPTPAMLEAMATAELGDDVYQQDPTVNALEALTARTLGKEAALLVPSGTSIAVTKPRSDSAASAASTTRRSSRLSLSVGIRDRPRTLPPPAPVRPLRAQGCRS